MEQFSNVHGSGKLLLLVYRDGWNPSNQHTTCRSNTCNHILITDVTAARGFVARPMIFRILISHSMQSNQCRAILLLECELVQQLFPTDDFNFNKRNGLMITTPNQCKQMPDAPRMWAIFFGTLQACTLGMSLTHSVHLQPLRKVYPTRHYSKLFCILIPYISLQSSVTIDVTFALLGSSPKARGTYIGTCTMYFCGQVPLRRMMYPSRESHLL